MKNKEKITEQEIVQEMAMFELADEYKTLRQEKDMLQFQLKELNAELERMEKDLITQMVDAEVPSFRRNGALFTVVTKEYPSAVAERKAELYDTMKEQGFEHLFTINSNTLSATVKELKANNEDVMPEWLDGLIKVAEKQSIQLRK